MEDEYQNYLANGYIEFGVDPELLKWVNATFSTAQSLSEDEQSRRDWLRCGGTWYAGVNVLPNDGEGGIKDANVSPIRGAAYDFIKKYLAPDPFEFDAAQISVCYPKYPLHGDEETDAAYRFRLNRYAAHVDGLHRSMPGRRRFLNETHGFIFGVPMENTAPDASPLVVWKGSHEVMRDMFCEEYKSLSPSEWANKDITDAYASARKFCFENLQTVELWQPKGGSNLVHRLALHGVAPWAETCLDRQRMIAYFRPDIYPNISPEWWVNDP